MWRWAVGRRRTAPVPAYHAALTARRAAPEFAGEEIEAIRALSRRLPAEDNLLWLPAHSIISQFDQQRHVVRPLVNAPALAEVLHDRSGRTRSERAIAAWLLTRARVLPEHIPSAMAALANLLEIRLPEPPLASGWRCVRAVAPSSAAFAAGVTLAVLLGATRIPTLARLLHSDAATPLIWTGICALPLVTFAVTALVLSIARGALAVPGAIRADMWMRLCAIDALGASGHPNNIVALAEAASAVNPRVRAAAISALKQVLAATGENSYGEVRSEVVPSLCKLLSHREVDVVIKALRALESVGDGRAVYPVRRVAERSPAPALQIEAARVLPVLIERRRLVEDPVMLLRPVTWPAVGATPAPPPEQPPDRPSAPPPRPAAAQPWRLAPRTAVTKAGA